MSVVLLVVLGVAVAGIAMMVAVATASVRRVDLYRWVAQQRPGAGAAGAILHAPWRVQATANTLIAAGVLLTALGLGALLVQLPWPLAATTALLVVVPAVVLTGYAVPRAVGRRWPEPIVARCVPWLDAGATLLGAVLPEPAAPAGIPATEGDELAEELPVLAGVLAFAERTARDVMTPRTDVVAVREGASLEDIARLIAESGYSRMPVYRDSLDNILGMIYAFDLLKVSPGAALPLRPVVMAPESKPCADLLFEMQRARRQFAVVLDEYGGTAGIATFEDLLEELVGEIFDEYDATAAADVAGIELMDASGTTAVDDVEARFGVTLRTEAETVGGLLARAAGRIPRAGERMLVGGLEFDVLAATPNRVERVVIRPAGVPLVALSEGG